ncbi:MAG: DUF3575 domain-containing protein [Candidatus Cryptobacteroides sp.]
MKTGRYILTMMLLSSAFLSVSASAQQKRTLTDALKAFQLKSGKMLAYSSTLTDKVTVNPSSTELEDILEGTGFTYSISGDVIYIIASVKEDKKDDVVSVALHKEEEVMELRKELESPYDGGGDYPIPAPSKVNVPPLKLMNVEEYDRTYDPKRDPSGRFAVKTDLVELSTSSLNIGLECALGRKMTVDFYGAYNPWTFSDNRKMKYWRVRPELRYWACHRFNGFFLSISANGGQFNWGGMLPWGFADGKAFGVIDPGPLAESRYQGWSAGAVIAFGWQWIAGKRLSIEAELGIAYEYIDYGQYRCVSCGTRLSDGVTTKLLPDVLRIGLVYFIK